MTVYLDLVFLINFFFDSILLFSVAIILKRQTNLKKIMLGSLSGTVTIFCLFLNINSITLFFIKILIAFLMVIITFNYKDITYTIKNIIYLYTTSILLGGFLYLLNINYSYTKNGIIFYSNGLNINYYIFLFLSPIIIYIYVKQISQLKNNYSNYYKIIIYFKNNKVLSVTSFLDTGNNLFDPYHNRPIILINKKIIKKYYDSSNYLLVPFDTINEHGLLKCISIDKIYIQGIGIKENVLLGITNKRIKIDGVDAILNKKLLEDLWKK